MSSLKKRRNTYYIKYTETINGDTKEIVRTLGTGNRKLAEKRQDILDSRVDTGQDPFDQSFNWNYKPKRTWYTIDDCCEDFLKAKEESCRYHSIRAYRQVVEKFIRMQRLSQKPIKSVTKDDFKSFLFRDGIKNTSRHSEKGRLRTFWNWCIKKGRVKDNFLEDIKLPQKNLEYHAKMISKEELDALFKKFRKHDQWRRSQKWFRDTIHAQNWFIPAMTVFFYSGLRRSEVGYDSNIKHSGLKGKHIHPQNKESIDFIYLSKAKRNKERFVPVSNRLEETLLEYFNGVRGWPGREEYVFLNARGEPVQGSTMQEVFNDFCEKANIPSSRTIHGMRHRRATTWLEMGFTLKEVKEMLGHYSIQVTDQLYIHLTPKTLKDKMDRLDES